MLESIRGFLVSDFLKIRSSIFYVVYTHIIAQNIGINSTTPVNTDHPSIKIIEENINVQTFKFQPVTEKQVIT